MDTDEGPHTGDDGASECEAGGAPRSLDGRGVRDSRVLAELQRQGAGEDLSAPLRVERRCSQQSCSGRAQARTARRVRRGPRDPPPSRL